MDKILVIILVMCSGVVFAQEDSTQVPVPGKPLTAQQVLTMHAAKEYQLAMRYNDHVAARLALFDILAENPASDSVLYSLSYMFLEAGQYASAAISAQDLNKMNPEHLGGIEILAVAYEKLGLMEKSLNSYEELYFKTSDYQSLYKAAFLQYQLKRYKESNTNIDVLLEKKEAKDVKVTFNTADDKQKEYPISVALYNLKGLNAEGLGNKEEAKKLYQKALELAPDFVLAQENIKNLEK